MSPNDTIEQDPSPLEEAINKRHNSLHKFMVFVFLLVGTVVATLLWINNGFAVSLGFIFLEAQLLILVATMGTTTAVLSQIKNVLTILTHGDVDFHFHAPVEGAEEKIKKGAVKFTEDMEKVLNREAGKKDNAKGFPKAPEAPSHST